MSVSTINKNDLVTQIRSKLKCTCKWNRVIKYGYRTNGGLRILSYVGQRLWNSLQNSVNNFKHKSKDLCFNRLREKDKNPDVYYD